MLLFYFFNIIKNKIKIFLFLFVFSLTSVQEDSQINMLFNTQHIKHQGIFSAFWEVGPGAYFLEDFIDVKLNFGFRSPYYTFSKWSGYRSSSISKIYTVCHTVYAMFRFIHSILSKIQGLFKDFKKTPAVFKDLRFMQTTDLSVRILLQKC